MGTLCTCLMFTNKCPFLAMLTLGSATEVTQQTPNEHREVRNGETKQSWWMKKEKKSSKVREICFQQRS